ncbi:small acid-soluble spore protein N [Gemmatimonadota bacterium]
MRRGREQEPPRTFRPNHLPTSPRESPSNPGGKMAVR